jgi:hypothetical protein
MNEQTENQTLTPAGHQIRNRSKRDHSASATIGKHVTTGHPKKFTGRKFGRCLRRAPDGPAGFGGAHFGLFFELGIAFVAGAAGEELVETGRDALGIDDVAARFHDLADHVANHLFDAPLLHDRAESPNEVVTNRFDGWFSQFRSDFQGNQGLATVQVFP